MSRDLKDTMSGGPVCQVSEVPVGPDGEARHLGGSQGSGFKISRSRFYQQAVSFISFIFVVVSTVGMTLNTMPSMRHRLPSLSRFIFFAKTEIEQSVKKCLWHPPPPQQPCQPPDRGQPPPRPRRSHLHLLVHPRVPPQVGGC